MARKKAAPAPPLPTPEGVARAARAGDFAAALTLARQLPETPENLALRKVTLAHAARTYADRDRPADFNRVMIEADTVDPADPAWAAERACILARGGRLADALARCDEASRAKVLGHAADRAIRLQSKDALPAELHAGFDAILTAFRHHEAGNEAAAREALEPVGLRSPFLEWKVLLRGLLAHAAADDARAAENLARLDPARLPSRLAAPYRLTVDPAFKASLPPADASLLSKQYEQLNTSPVVERLREIARHLGRDKPLTPAFRAAESLLPQLRHSVPHLIPRLANCLYHAILQQGQPDDLPRYRKLFGTPPVDPNFHKLQAIIAEQIGDPAAVHAHWRKYDEWLSTNPPGWPPAVLARARAVVWTRLGENAEQAAEEPEEEEAIFGFFGAPRRPKRKPKPLDPPAAECFRRATLLAPDWPDATSRLFDSLVEADQPAEAEAAARELLGHHPENLPALAALAELVQTQGRAEEAADLWLRAAAVNPLDRATRHRSAVAVLAVARRKLIAGKAADADALFETHKVLLEEQTPAGLAALRSVIKVKLRQPDEAAALRDKALTIPGARVSAAYRMTIDSQLAKLKPAEKKAAEKLFADELAKGPTPLEVNQLIAAYDSYHIEALTYRGQKTHEKKILDQVARCLTAAAPEVDFERLGDVLLHKREWKHAKKLAEACTLRFPANPHFLLARSEAGLATGEREYYVERRLRRAKELAEASAEPRHRGLVGRIDRLLQQVATPFDFFDAFFGSGR